MEKYILEAYFRFKTNKSTMDGTMDHLLEMYRNGQVSVSKIITFPKPLCITIEKAPLQTVHAVVLVVICYGY